MMNYNFWKFIGFKFQKCIHNIIVLQKSTFSHSTVSLKNKCGSKGLPWRIMFFGNDDFSVKNLQKLTSKLRTHTIISKLDVVTTSKCYGINVRSFVNEEKLDIYDWPVFTTHLNGKYDIGVVASFGRLIPEEIKCFPLGIINVHPSLLPRWRGAAPIIYTILNGDLTSGFTIIKIHSRRFDVGEIVRQHSCTVGKDETAEELRKRLADMGGRLLVDCFKELRRNLRYAIPQPENDITYYVPKVYKSISIINWTVLDSNAIYNMYRAFYGLWPLSTTWNGISVKLIKVCRYQMLNLENQLKPGQIVYNEPKKMLLVKCGGKGGFISVEKLKILGHKTMSGEDFFNCYMQSEKELFFNSTLQ